jgi:hypothetical protein
MIIELRNRIVMVLCFDSSPWQWIEGVGNIPIADKELRACL